MFCNQHTCLIVLEFHLYCFCPYSASVHNRKRGFSRHVQLQMVFSLFSGDLDELSHPVLWLWLCGVGALTPPDSHSFISQCAADRHTCRIPLSGSATDEVVSALFGSGRAGRRKEPAIVTLCILTLMSQCESEPARALDLISSFVAATLFKVSTSTLVSSVHKVLPPP
jgi:hypothetical protein